MTQQASGDPQPSPGGGGYRLQWRDAVIAVLVAALAAALWAAFGVRRERPREEPADGERVTVFDVVLDREGRQWVDVVFDRPVLAEDGAVRVGDVLDPPPATIEPPLGGSWRWRDRHVLRFAPSGGFPPATEYTVALIPERILEDGRTLGGDALLRVRIDRFLVEGVEVWEEPVPDEAATVFLRGTLRFNYAVDPGILAPRVRLEDPSEVPGAVPPEVQLETGWQSPQIGFRTTALRKQKAARTLRLVVAADLTPAEGNVALGKPFAHQIPLGSSEVLEVRELAGEPGLEESSLRLVLSSPVTAEIARPYLKVEPEAAFRLAAQRNVLRLTGGFAPGESYKVALDQGLPAADGAVLRQPYSATVRLDNLPPSVDFQSQGLFLSRGGLRNLAIETVNVDRLELAVDRVYRNNLFFFLQYGGGFDQDTVYRGDNVWHPFGDRLVEKKLRLRGARNAKVTTVLSLDEQVDVRQPGLYRVLLGRTDHWQAPQRWLLVTDLGAVAKQGTGEFLVWALSHRTLAPVAGAAVELISDQNQTIARGTTDAAGFWRFRDRRALAEHRPFLATLAKGDDFSFVYLDRMEVDTTGLEVAGAARPAAGYTAFLYGERDLYRPGETVRGAALVRDAELRPAPEMPVLLRHRDPQGREIATRTLALDGRGLVEFEWATPAYALTGRHGLELLIADEVVGRYGFQLEEFVPDRIKVEIQPAAAAVAPGQPLAYDVAGTYLFGPAAAGLAAETRVRLIDSTFAPGRFAAFSFRDDDRSWSDREVFNQAARLDDAGRAAFRAELPPERRLPSSLEAVITARVQEEGGRGVTARTRLAVHPFPYYVGLRRLEGGYPEPGQAVELEWVAVQPDGSDATAGALTAELVLDRWQTVLRRTAAGNFRYESTRESVVVETRQLAGGAASGRFRVTPREYGSHRVVLTDPASGASAAAGFYTGGWGYSPWAVENPDRLELELDKPEYRPGETATVQVRSPYPGRLLLAVEQEEVFDLKTYELTGNTATLTLPVRAAWRPNAYLTATLVRPVEAIEPGAVGRAFGAVPVSVDRTANRLPLAVEAPAELRSGSRLEIGVTATPGAAVTVAAVDEGILQLIAQRTPDPFEFFYRKLRLGVRSFDTFSLLLPEVEAPTATGGGEPGAGAAQYVRTESIRRAEPVAFWSGVLDAGADGRAQAVFQLPEFTGAVRLMAVAAEGRRFGSAEATTRVRDPLVLSATLPRILSFAETLEVPATLRNDTGRPGRFELELAVEGQAAVDGEAKRTVEIPNAAERTVYFAVKTGLDEGAAGFVLTARGNGETARARAEVGVRPDLPPLTVAQSGALAQAETELPATDAGYRPASLERRLQIGPLPLVRFGRQLADLLRYPYGCLEQTLSQAFPLIYLEELARQFEPELLDPEKGGAEPAAWIDEALRRLAWHQVPGGGFALWRGGAADPWTSVYAAHFLVEAARAGHPVDPQLTERALDHLRGLVRAKERYGTDELERGVYALYVLARAAEAELGMMDFLRERQFGKLGRASRALLAAAYAAVGNRDAVGELAAGLEDVERFERQTGRNLRSTVRNRALLLLALQEAEPESPRIPALVERLGRDAAELDVWTTQETAFALMAIGQLVRRQAERPPYAGALLAGGEEIGRFTSAESAVFELPATGAVRVVMDPGYQAGSAFYSLTTRGVPRDAVFRPAAAGLEVERQLLDRDGGAVDPLALEQGDLVVVKTRVRSVSGPLDNVVVQQLLPSGLEVENPRLATTEGLPWVADANLEAAHLDLRDDRILVFTDLPANEWRNLYSLARAVAPGNFRLPPLHAEAMYNPALNATGPRGAITVKRRREKG